MLSTRLTAVRVVVDVVAVAVASETGDAVRLGGATREPPRKKQHGVAQSHKADRAKVLNLHGSRSLHSAFTRTSSRGDIIRLERLNGGHFTIMTYQIFNQDERHQCLSGIPLSLIHI